MANPAQALLEVFRQWAAPDRATQQAARGVANGEHTDAVAALHVTAMRLIWEISLELDRLEQDGSKVTSYRKMLTPWTHAVLAYPGGWDDANTGRRNLFVEHYLDSLEHLAELIAVRRPQLAESNLNAVRQLLDEVDQLLLLDATITAELRGYIHQLVQECRHAVADFETLGTFDLKQALFRLWVASGAAADQSESSKQKWRSFGKRILPGTVTGLLVGAPGLVVQAIGAATNG